MGHNLLCLYFLPGRLNDQNGIQFLLKGFVALHEDVPVLNLRDMWFQLDGGPAHFFRDTRTWLNTNHPFTMDR